MKHRFFVPEPIVAGSTIALPEEEQHHARVLRVRDGEDVEVFDADGNNFAAKFAEGQLRVEGAAANRELRTAIHLAMSIIQLDKFELVLQKCTELGVASFVPLIADRTEVRIERLRGKEERWKKIVLEAVKQSGRSRIPRIERAMTFDEAILCDGLKIVFDADIEPSPTTDNRQPTTLFIGPEGGFSERELELARGAGAAFERLGPRRLRAETAAIAAVCGVTNER
jgi:16S rRNA (uracil1498-N3)-methyltransferase